MATIFLQVLIFMIFGYSGDHFGSEAVKVPKRPEVPKDWPAVDRLENVVEFLFIKTETVEKKLAIESEANQILANKNDLLEEQLTLLGKQFMQMEQKLDHLEKELSEERQLNKRNTELLSKQIALEREQTEKLADHSSAYT